MTAEPEVRKHFYRGVLRLGNVAVSRHAQARMIAEGVTQEAFDRALLTPTHPDVGTVRMCFGASGTGCAS